jgi:hypothetical protein
MFEFSINVSESQFEVASQETKMKMLSSRPEVLEHAEPEISRIRKHGRSGASNIL